MDYSQLQAYEVKRQEELSDIGAVGVLLTHKKTGAHILLMENDDDNKVFCVGFRTPVSDSTGVPHILEHSVLCGSENFPVKDPFVELVKGSLNTFLNAMTYPDKTLYPVASCNDTDFQNLMHVYMDAVFYPKIYEHKEIFLQEGWSYKLADKDDELTYNGVVYNEMKGAFSSPDSVLDRMITHALFPDTNYAHESGGDPDVIPTLTYEDFLDFHRKFYHPSNSYLFLYGDMDMIEKLNWLDEMYLSRFEKRVPESSILLQKPFEQMGSRRALYSISSTESLENHTFLSYNKVIGTVFDQKLVRAFEVLDYALLSAPGAPLKKALMDAGISQDIGGSFDDGIQQPIFSVIAKNTDEDKQEQFVSIIEDTLRCIVRDGINPKSLEAAINYYEFRFREADFGGYPKGLIYGLQAYGTWIYNEDEPFLNLRVLDLIEELRSEIGSGYYEKLITEYILDNPHGCLVTIAPQQGLTAERDRQVKEELERYKQSLTVEEREQLVRRTRELEEYQDAPESREDLERIPLLTRDQLSRCIDPTKNEMLKTKSGVPVVYHDIRTNGIGYVDVLFSLEGLDEEDIPYVGILNSIFGFVDTKNYAYDDLNNEINIHTGGIDTSPVCFHSLKKQGERSVSGYLSIQGKALYPKLSYVFSLMREIVMTSNLSDKKRIREILERKKGRMARMFTQAGHMTAATRGLSYVQSGDAFRDSVSGVGQYELVKELCEKFDGKADELVGILQRIARRIFRKEHMLISYTADRAGVENMLESADAMARELCAYEREGKTDGNEEQNPVGDVASGHAFNDNRAAIRNEGFLTSSKVQYVARCGTYTDKGFAYTGALHILRVILSYDYLWTNIRVKGGAYGCMSSFTRQGSGYFVSYRDPNLRETNDVYEGIVDYLETFSADERTMDQFVIGAISSVTRPLTPMQAGAMSFMRYMIGVTEEELQKERNEILDATVEDIRALAGIVKAVLSDGIVCAIGSEEKLQSEAGLFGELRSLFS